MRVRLLLLAVLFVLFATAGSQVRFTTDTQDILPADSDLRETLAAAQRFPGAQLILVEVDGTEADRATLERETLALAERLAGLEAVASVRAGFSAEDGLEIRNRIAPHATAYVDADTLAERTSAEGVMAQVEAQRKRLVGFAGPFLAGGIREDPLGIRQLALDQLQSAARPGIRPDGDLLVDTTGKRALLLVSAAVEASAIGPHDARIAALDAAIAETPLPTQWFGGVRMAWETASAIERDVRVTAGLGMVLLAIVLFAGFRSWRPLVGAVLPSAVAAGAASMGAWFASPVHGLQLGFSAALAGLAVDYWVHLYLAAAAQPDQPDAAGRFRAALDALRDLMPALVVSAGSTALAFALLTTSALPIVRVLGVTGAAAAIGALLGTVVAGPVAWTLFGRPVEVAEPRLPTRFALGIGMGAVVLALLGTTSRFEPDPIALIATSPAAEAAQEAFADRYQLTTLRGIVLLDGETPGAALDRAARVQRAFSALEGVAPTGPGLIVPGPETAGARRAALPDVETLQARLDAAAEAAQLPRFEGAAQRILDWAEPPPSDLWDSSPMAARVTLLDDAGDLEGFSGAVAMISVPVADETVVPVLERTLAEADPDALLVVPGQLASASMDAARQALVSRAALGGLAVFVLLSFRHRSVFMAALALAPAATAVAGALGLMALSGRPWNPVSLAAMVPVLGLAVDYGVFMTERATRTAPRAVILSAATTLAGFATLALAYSPALFGVGVATVAGVGMAALTALLVVPAVLDRREPEPLDPGTYDRQRWPGWDGWLLAVVGLVASAGAWLRGTDPVLAVAILALPATWLVLTALLRTPRRAPTPDVGLRILTVIPTKDNAGSIAEVVRGCLAHTEHLLVVDDGCTDGSGELAAEAGATLVRHPINRGKGAALETALDWCVAHGFSHIVAIDADGQHEPNDLPSFYEAVRTHPDAVVAGVRDMSEAPKGARYARANSNFWVWVETSQRMGDTQCGYRAYPVGPIRDLALVPSRYQWEVEVLVRSVWAGIPVVDHPCRVFYPPADERVSSYRKVVDTARISWLNAHLIAERILWPPRWFPRTLGRLLRGPVE
jgi:predicted exporter